MTNEELDNARAEEAWKIFKHENVAAVAARLAREGWTPPVPVDPDLAEAKKIINGFSDTSIHSYEDLALAAIKRGRALAAEAKNLTIPGMAGHTDRNGTTSMIAVIVTSKNGGLNWTATPFTEATPPEDAA